MWCQKKGGAGGGIGADAVEEVGCVLVHAVVDHDCFVLGWVSWWKQGCMDVTWGEGRGK